MFEKSQRHVRLDRKPGEEGPVRGSLRSMLLIQVDGGTWIPPQNLLASPRKPGLSRPERREVRSGALISGWRGLEADRIQGVTKVQPDRVCHRETVAIPGQLGTERFPVAGGETVATQRIKWDHLSTRTTLPGGLQPSLRDQGSAMTRNTAQPDLPSFEALGLPPTVLAALHRKGIRIPTPIQSMAIPVIGQGRDLIVQAATGSGKTLAFGLPLLVREPVDERSPTVLVTAPTRDLARQIHAELDGVRGDLERRIVLACGGEALDRQVEVLRKGAHWVIGTPGRLVELAEAGTLSLKQVRYWILDEADELLLKGYEAELAKLVDRMPTQRQTFLFSATFPSAVQRLADAAMRKPHRIQVPQSDRLPASLVHRTLEAPTDAWLDTLISWYERERPFLTLLFCPTRKVTQEVSDALFQRGFVNEALSGELSGNKRKRILDRFRSGDLPMVVATDLAARGLDVPGLTHVVHWGLPRDIETYVHRSGRTGRAGREGVSLALVSPRDRHQVAEWRQQIPFEAWRNRGK